jgi:HEAT repeats
MKRTHAAALAAALVAAVPAWGQQPPARPDVMTLSTADGKATHACKVLRTYKHPSGGIAYEVRDEVTGEVMTVIDRSAPDDVKAVKTETVTESKSADPIMAPKTYAAPKVQQQIADPPGYTRPPVPATRRWFNWFKPTPQPQPQPVQQTRSAVNREMLAAYDPDPVIRMIGSLNDDLLPSMREVAAEALSRDGGIPAQRVARPEVVQALVRAAATDPAPSVRVCCCRCLANMKVTSPECLSALKGLEDDREETVRTAAAAARATLEQP